MNFGVGWTLLQLYLTSDTLETDGGADRHVCFRISISVDRPVRKHTNYPIFPYFASLCRQSTTHPAGVGQKEAKNKPIT
jgi:hypothetical protein